MPELISIEEARSRVLAEVRPLPSEGVSLERALGRVLAEDVTSRVDVPPFDSSAMDGFAVAEIGGGGPQGICGGRAGPPPSLAVRAGTAVAPSTPAAAPR